MGFIGQDHAKKERQSFIKPHPPLDLPLEGGEIGAAIF
jgi:hypothetical protein